MAYYTGLNGCFSVFATIRFIHKLKEIRPNVIHIHNLHSFIYKSSTVVSIYKKRKYTGYMDIARLVGLLQVNAHISLWQNVKSGDMAAMLAQIITNIQKVQLIERL